MSPLHGNRLERERRYLVNEAVGIWPSGHVVGIIVIALILAVIGPEPVDPPVAAFSSVDGGAEGVVDLALMISSPTKASCSCAYLAVEGCDSRAIATLSSCPAALVPEDGRQFTITYIDEDAEGMAETEDHIVLAGRSTVRNALRE